MHGKPASPFFICSEGIEGGAIDDSKVAELQKYTSFSRNSAYEPLEMQKCS